MTGLDFDLLVADGKSHTVCLVVDQSGRHLYVDGVEVAS